MNLEEKKHLLRTLKDIITYPSDQDVKLIETLQEEIALENTNKIFQVIVHVGVIDE